MSHLTVTTAVEGAEHALRASFRDGALLGTPQPVAGCRGTTLTIEDLFYNTPSRRRALGSPADEHARCADVVGRYAAHRAGVAFALRKAGAARPDVLTTGIGSSGAGVGLSSSSRNASLAAGAAAADAASAGASSSSSSLLQQQPLPRRASRLDAIRAVYGAPLAKALLPFAFRVGGGGGGGGGGGEAAAGKEDAAATATDAGNGKGGEDGKEDPEGEQHNEPAPRFEATGYVSAPDWPGRRSAFVLFVNGRSVEAGALRRAAEGAHAAAAPRGSRPFCFVDLRLPPEAVDANVHPTKREVAFLHRDAVAAALADAVDSALRRADRQGRAFVQQLLPGAAAPPVAGANGGGGGGGGSRTRRAATEGTAAATAAEANAATTTATTSTRRDRAGGDHNLVRVDARARTLDAFVAFRQQNGSGNGGAPAAAGAAGASNEGEEGGAPQQAAAAAAAAASAKPVASILAAPARRRGAREEGGANGAASLFGTATAAEEEDPLLLSAPAGLPTSSSIAATAAPNANSSFRPRPNPPASSRLPAVERLLSRADSQAHPGLEAALRSASYVGMADRARALVQAGASLLLLDLRPLLKDLARQQALRRVGAHAVARISVAGAGAAGSTGEGEGEEEKLLPSVAELIELALLEEKAASGENEVDDEPLSAARIAEAASLASRLLVLKREPLRRHFGVEVTSGGRLAALPEIVDGLSWRPSRLPALALALARDVDFSSLSSGNEEGLFFESAAEALASCVSLPGWSEEEEDDDDEEEEDEEEGDGEDEHEKEKKESKEHHKAPTATTTTTPTASFLDRPPTRGLERCVAHVVLPAMRVHLRPPRARSADGAVVELTRLQSLYKIFERC